MAPPRRVLILITVDDQGHISVDIRGPVRGPEGILEALLAAEQLVKQGIYRSK
jgi:hypothetical protein